MTELDQMEEWINRAVGHYEDDAYDDCDAAISIADAYGYLARERMHVKELELATERHRVEVTKRRTATDALRKITPGAPGAPKGPQWTGEPF